MPRTYDDWKLATPPEYEEAGPSPVDELLEAAEGMTLEEVSAALSELEWQYPALREEISDVRQSLGL